MAAIETETNGKDQKEFDWMIETHGEEILGLEILCITGEQGLVCIKPKIIGCDQLGSLELEEGMSGYLSRATPIECAKEQLRMASPAEQRNARDADEDWKGRCTQTAGS